MNSNKTKKGILDQIDSGMNNLSNLNEQFAQYQAQNFQGMDDMATSKETLFKLFNITKDNFTGIPDNHNRKSKSIKEEFDLRKNKKSASNKQKMEEGFSLEKEGSKYYNEPSYNKKSIIEKEQLAGLNNIDLEKKRIEKFADKQNKKDEKNSRGL